VDKLTIYLQSSAPPASATHPLLRLIYSFVTSTNLSAERYSQEISDSALRFASAQGFTTSVSFGRTFKGVFYGPGITEIIVGYDEWFDLDASVKNWRSVQAVKPFLHPKSDLGLQVLNGKPHSQETGLAVIGVNIPLLAIQYWAFLHDKTSLSSQLGVQGFLSRYVIPNMLQSHVELAFLNRIFKRYYIIDSEQDTELLIKHRIALPEYKYYLDKVIDTVIVNLSRVNYMFEHQLQNIPAFYHDNMLSALIMPDIMQTQQVDWALIVSRLRYLSFLTDLTSNKSVYSNRMHGVQLKRKLALYFGLETMSQKLPASLYFEQESYLDNIYHTLLNLPIQEPTA
jgi:hypothetical protein